MKKFIKSALFFVALLGSNFANSQTTAYADTILAVSQEFNFSDATCSYPWAACHILGAPDVYPSCGDIAGAWTFLCGTSRQWIEIGYSTQLHVDTVRIYETNHSGAIDTVYLRNASTGSWNTIYAAPSIPFYACNVFDIIIPTTAYKVDAVRIAIADFSLGWCYPEYDAVALIGSVVSVRITDHQLKNSNIFPNPSNGQITVKTGEIGTSILTVFDVLGNVVFSKIISQTENISLNLPSGIYFLATEKNGKKEIEKLVIQ